MTTSEYIQGHRKDDVRELALQPVPDGVDLRSALVQISGWQKAQDKLPSWTTTDGILFPEHISMEQCSSELTAEYKRSVAGRLCREGELIDLTAGFGVDATVMGRAFRKVTLVEHNPELCDILLHNLPLLGIRDYEVVCDDCENMTDKHLHAHRNQYQLLFIDPARRDTYGRKTVLISDCTPDVCGLQDALTAMAEVVMIKLSPMLDLTSVQREIHGLAELHVVSTGNECKEVLAVVGPGSDSPVRVYCTNLTKAGADVFEYTQDEEQQTIVVHLSMHDASRTKYLYEPNASILKAGAYKSIAGRYGLVKAAPNSHLYVSDHLVPDFPGRSFSVSDVVQPNKAGMKMLRQLQHANITTRNYPLAVNDLRRKLNLRDGGDKYLFATTLADESHVVFVCEKIK